MLNFSTWSKHPKGESKVEKRNWQSCIKSERAPATVGSDKIPGLYPSFKAQVNSVWRELGALTMAARASTQAEPKLGAFGKDFHSRRV
jgi:hypothetical protein